MPAVIYQAEYPKRATKDYYAALTGIRAVAAYMVVIYHLSPLQFNRSATAVNWLDQFINTWSSGVTVFFVLSGFLIAMRYADSVELKPIWWRKYLQNRFARIYPVYFLLTVLSFVLLQTQLATAPTIWHTAWTTAFWKDKLAFAFTNITLLRAYFQNIYLVGLPTAWSLTVEETFYLCAPLLLLGVRWSCKLLLVYPFLFIGIGLALVRISVGAPYGFMGSYTHMLCYTFFGRCTEFIVGIGLATIMRRTEPMPTASSRFTTLGTVSFLVVLLLAVTVNVYLTPTESGTPTAFLALILFGLPLPVALLFWGLVKEQTLISRFLSHPVLQLLGKSSYVLYLLHLGPINDTFTRFISGNIFVQVIAYTAASIVLYKFVEHPIHLRLRAKK